MKTKEQAVREELAFGKEAGLLSDLVRAVPNLSLSWVQSVADGGELDAAQVDVLFSALNLDESALDDEDEQMYQAHTELVNVLMGVPEVEVGQVWTGLTGSRLMVQEVKGGRARLSYEDDPGDETWEDVEDIRTAFTLATPRITELGWKTKPEDMTDAEWATFKARHGR